MDNQLIAEEKHSRQRFESNKWYEFYVGLDIGADFHVAACIPFGKFRNEKEWKRQKTMKFHSDSKGIIDFLSELRKIRETFGLTPSDFFILLEPTGGHYSYLVMKVLLDEGYHLFQVENKSVKDFRERQLGLNEKSDEIDARIMAYMGWHKTLHPDMKGVRLVKPATPTQILFRTLTRDRWLLSTQLTRRKNQVQQLFSVTNPELKRAFKRPGSTTVMKFVLQYPTAKEMSQVTQEELRKALIAVGAKTIATKASVTLSEYLPHTLAVEVPHLIERQTWLIQEALRIEEAIDSIDRQISVLLHGDESKGIEPHPYTTILKSFPIMSDVMACTLIGAIGDVDRFSNYLEFKKYLGVAAENKTSGTSVAKTRQTYEGVRDTRRILFLMVLVLISPNTKPNLFKQYYDRLVNGRGMSKRKAIGHVCGKIAQVMYSCLKNNSSYDPFVHAKQLGVSWEHNMVNVIKLPDNVDEFENNAAEMAEKIEI
ncbi:IS110 family transposase [Brevibacillus brevis]|uniref:IS110 family transposase n=1 Tax=Brevibacillus brevis TaxID=1393 RepID=UPI001EDBABC1|nr:IS110 family transposase [Brevibacillus brevis]